jgi:hypothetical protein
MFEPLEELHQTTALNLPLNRMGYFRSRVRNLTDHIAETTQLTKKEAEQ